MLVVLVFAVVMAGAYYWLVHRPLYEQLRGLDETEVRLLFRKLRNQLRLDFEGAQSELTSIAKRDVIRGFDPVQLDKALAQEEQTTTFYKKFTIMDMNGRVVSRPSIPSSNGLDRSDRGYFRGPLGNNGLYIDDVRPFGHGLSVSLSVPVVGLDGKTCGVLAGQVELTGKSPRLCKTTTGWPSRSKHEVILISRKGFKVGHSTGPLDATTLAEVDMHEHPLFPLAGRKSKGSVYSVGGVEYYGIACKLPPFDWVLRGKQSTEEREQSLRVAIDLLHECITSASRLTNRLAQPAIQQLGLAKALEALVASYDAQHDVEFVVETGPVDQSIDAETADIGIEAWQNCCTTSSSMPTSTGPSCGWTPRTGVSTSKSRTTALGSGPNRCPRVRVRLAVSVCSVSVSGSVRSVDRSASRAIPIGAASSPLSSL
jgi:hypothetical protein